MKPQVARFFKAFVFLKEEERSEVLEIAKAIELVSGTPKEAQLISSIGLDDALAAAINFGPFPGPCPTCGN